MRLVDYKQLREIVRISRTQVRRWMKERGFPHPVKIGFRVFWRYDEVIEWIKRQPREVANH